MMDRLYIVMGVSHVVFDTCMHWGSRLDRFHLAQAIIAHLLVIRDSCVTAVRENGKSRLGIGS